MKLFKSLLLGSAAGLVAVSGASAADLGVKKPAAAVEYVRVCSAHGAGFWYIPGSDVCIKIGGRVRAEYLYATDWTRGDDISSFRANGRIEADFRQTTSYGLLRAFVRYDVYASGGRYVSSVNSLVGAGDLTGTTQTPFLDKAFIQFYTGSAGFITAGRSTSFFDFYANTDNWTALPGSDRGNTNLFAYTFTFGGGLTATLSVEDSWQRRLQTGATTLVTDRYRYAGQQMPDIVGNIRIDQSWGSAQLSAAIHQIHLGNTYVLPVGTPARFYGSEYGYAIQGGVKLNLPMLAAGDTLWLQAAYANGATDYAAPARNIGAGTFGLSAGTIANADGYVTSLGSVKKATAWSVTASFVHNFTPTIQGAVFGGYGSLEYPGSVAATGYRDFTNWAIGGQLSWLPVRGMRIGAEVMYNKIDPEGAVAIARAGKATLVKGSYDVWTARLRFQRDF